MTTATAQRMTAAEFDALPGMDDFELLDGRPVRKDVGVFSQVVVGAIHTTIADHIRSGQGGRVFPEGPVRLWPTRPDHTRRPDIAYYRRGRVPVPPAGAITVAPDFVVEVLSPSDTVSELDERLRDYAEAGIPLCWVIHPEARLVDVYRQGRLVRQLTADDTLEGEDILPGFSLPIAELFASLGD